MNTTWQSRYFDWIYKFLNTKDKIRTHEVDFTRPWYHLALKQKWAIGFTILFEVVQSSFGNLIPIWLTLTFTSGRFEYMLYVAAAYAALQLINILAMYGFYLANNSLGTSYFNSSYSYFLTVDPIFHSTKSSGKIISKISGSWGDFTGLINSITFNILPAISSFATSAIALATVDSTLAIYTIPAFFLITGVNGYGYYYNSKIFKKRTIKAREESNATATENLIQNNLIRATFATEDQLNKYHRQLKKLFSMYSTSNTSSNIVATTTRLLVIASVVLIASRLFEQTINRSLEPELAGSLLVTYYLGSRSIIRIGRVFYTTIDSYQGLQDMWEYVRNFGQQTYPVIDSDTKK